MKCTTALRHFIEVHALLSRGLHPIDLICVFYGEEFVIRYTGIFKQLQKKTPNLCIAEKEGNANSFRNVRLFFF